MDFFKKFIAFLTGYFVLYGEVGYEILNQWWRFLHGRWQRLRALPLAEQTFAALSPLLLILAFVPWRGYAIRFSDNALRHHGITSGDSLLISLGCLIALLPLFSHLFPSRPRQLPKARFYRIAGVVFVLFLALFNAFFPQRISPAREAVFSWGFYSFLGILAGWVTSGILGIVCYAQYPAKN